MDTQAKAGVARAADLQSRLSAREFDFIDIGCSKGGSMHFAALKLGGTKGVGLDVDPDKLAKAQEAGWTVYNFDAARDALPSKTVRFVTCFHVLEHLTSFETSMKLLRNAIRAATDFVAIRHPFFDIDGMLASYNMKFYFSDWNAHTNHLTSLDHYNYQGFFWEGAQPVTMSSAGNL